MWLPEPIPRFKAQYHAMGYWQCDLIGDLIEKQIIRHSKKFAVRDARGKDIVYSELGELTSRLAGFLKQKGVPAGSIVTICLPNCVEAVVAMVAVLNLGAIVNPIPVTYGRREIEHIIRKCNSSAVFVSHGFKKVDFLPVVGDIGAALGISPIVVCVGQDEPQIGYSFKEAISTNSFGTTERVDANAPAAVLFTSGTESQPKGAVHTHNTILFGERAFSEALSIGESDICFMASPVTHTTGFLHGVVMTLCTGGTLSLLDIFEGNRALDQMISHETTWTMGATTFLTDTVAAIRSKSLCLPKMRFFLCGGAPIPEGVVKLAADAGLRVLSVYGSTESPPHAVVLPKDPFANAWTSDGRPLPGIETRLVGEDQTDVGPGEEGEEWSRGPNTFLGYLDEPELTNNNMTEDGWHRSGDLARYLPDGPIRIVGRKKDVIVRGGQKISAREVEDILANLPSVKEVAVIPFPHDRLGEITCAVLVTTHGTTITLDEVARFLASQGLAKYKWPERLLCWAALPKTASGKIQKLAIRRQVQELVQ